MLYNASLKWWQKLLEADHLTPRKTDLWAIWERKLGFLHFNYYAKLHFQRKQGTVLKDDNSTLEFILTLCFVKTPAMYSLHVCYCMTSHWPCWLVRKVSLCWELNSTFIQILQKSTYIFWFLRGSKPRDREWLIKQGRVFLGDHIFLFRKLWGNIHIR